MGGQPGGVPPPVQLPNRRIQTYFETLSEFEPYTRPTMSRAEKGELGELRQAAALQRAGYIQAPSKLSGNQGFDGVWVKYGSGGKPVHIIIGEAKFSSTGKSSLATTKGKGQQMSKEWIDGTVEQMLRSKDPAVRATGRLLDKNPGIIDLKINVLNGQGVNRWNVLKPPAPPVVPAPPKARAPRGT